MTTDKTAIGTGGSSPALDGSSMIPDELVNGYLNHLSWSDQVTDREKKLVVANIRGFAYWLRTHMHGLYTPIYTKKHIFEKKCPEYSSKKLTTTWCDETVPYDDGGNLIKVLVRIPIRCCDDCGFEFTDEEAESLIDETVKRETKSLP